MSDDTIGGEWEEITLGRGQSLEPEEEDAQKESLNELGYNVDSGAAVGRSDGDAVGSEVEVFKSYALRTIAVFLVGAVLLVAVFVL